MNLAKYGKKKQEGDIGLEFTQWCEGAIVTVTLFELSEDCSDREELNPTLVKNVSMMLPKDSARGDRYDSPTKQAITEENEEEYFNIEKSQA